MNDYEKSLQVLCDLFAKDFQFSLATSKDNIPNVRVVDTFYDNGSFYVVTYAQSQKVQEIMSNGNACICKDLYRFNCKAYNIGHPLIEENKEIREKLIKVFEPWYFAHNNENDENMCYVKLEPYKGFFYKDGTGYSVDFEKKEANTFPFEFSISVI